MDSELNIKRFKQAEPSSGLCTGMVVRVALCDHLESCATYATWQSVDCFTKNQIEYFLIDERHALNIRDVRSCRTADYDIDYSFGMYLILMENNKKKYDTEEEISLIQIAVYTGWFSSAS